MIINEQMIQRFKEEHEKEVEIQKFFLNSNDRIDRAYAKSVVYGIHDPVLYAIREQFFNQVYSGIDYVLSVFSDYGYVTEEYYEDGIHCINVLKNNAVYAKLFFDDEYKRISYFNIK